MHEVIEVKRCEVGLSGGGGEVVGLWMLCSIH